MSQQVGNRPNAPLKRSRPNKTSQQISPKSLSNSESERYFLSLAEIFGGPRSLSERKRVTNSIQCGNQSFDISFYIKSPNQQHDPHDEGARKLAFVIQRSGTTLNSSSDGPQSKKRRLTLGNADLPDHAESDSNHVKVNRFRLKVHVDDKNGDYKVYETHCRFRSRNVVDLTSGSDCNTNDQISSALVIFPVESLQSIASRYSLSTTRDDEGRCAECGGISRTNNSIMIHFKCCDIYYHLHCTGYHSESVRKSIIESIDESGSSKMQCPRCIAAFEPLLALQRNVTALKPPNLYRSLSEYVIYLRFEIEAVSDDSDCGGTDGESFSNLLSQIQMKYHQSIDKWKGGELKRKQLSTANEDLMQKNDDLKKSCDQWSEKNKALKEKVKVYMDRCQELHEQNTKITKRSKELCDDNQKLKGTVDSLQKKVNLFEGKTEALNPLTMKDLDDLQMKLQESMRSVQDQREKKVEQEYQCRLCFDRRKNVYFIDGCDHVEICGQCASTMGIKQCPRCTASFSEFKILNIY